MKIVIVHLDFNAYFPQRLRALKFFLANKGHELFIFEMLGTPMLYSFSYVEKNDLNIETFYPDKTYQTVSRKMINRDVYKRLMEINPDIVITGTIVFPPSAAAIRWAKENKKALVVFENAKVSAFPRNKIVTWVKRKIYGVVDSFVCPSSDYIEDLKYWGFSKEQIFFGLNVTNNRFWAEKCQNTDFRMLPKHYFLTVGRQVPFKNLDTFLKAYLEYKRQGGNIPLVMVGEGDSHRELEVLSSGISDITFLPFQSYEKLRQIFINAKCLFLPSFKKETWGLIVNEAMAAGKIVAVSTECGCANTLVKERVNGFLYNPLSEKEMISIMFEIQNMSIDEIHKMQNEGRKIISNWDLDKFVEGVYSAVLYAISHKKKISLLDHLLVKLWKGQMKNNSVK